MALIAWFRNRIQSRQRDEILTLRAKLAVKSELLRKAEELAAIAMKALYQSHNEDEPPTPPKNGVLLN